MQSSSGHVSGPSSTSQSCLASARFPRETSLELGSASAHVGVHGGPWACGEEVGVRAGTRACRGLWGCPRGCPTSPSPLPALDGIFGASPEPGVEAKASGAAPGGCGGAGGTLAELRALAQAHPSEHHEICLAASLPCSKTSLNAAPKPPPFIPHLLILTCHFPAPSLTSSSPPGVTAGPWGCSLAPRAQPRLGVLPVPRPHSGSTSLRADPTWALSSSIHPLVRSVGTVTAEQNRWHVGRKEWAHPRKVSGKFGCFFCLKSIGESPARSHGSRSWGLQGNQHQELG